MNRARFLLLILGGGLAALSPARGEEANRPMHIALAGDSTVATYPADIAQKGWGQYLQTYFDPGVVIDNFAVGGRSTKTFLGEGTWAKLIASKPQIILIQFGHNDSHTPDHPEHTDPQGEYRTLLLRFVDEARAAGALPILVTPVQRRTKLDNLIPYAEAMKQVAAERKVALIDLHELSGALYARLGPAATAALAKSADDSTHFNEQGARAVADLVEGALLPLAPRLRGHLSADPR